MSIMKISLSENKLKQIVAESVSSVLNELSYLEDRKYRIKKCWMDPKVQKLQKLGYGKYYIDVILDRYNYDISNVSFEELKKRVEKFKHDYVDEDETDYDDYNNRIRTRPTLQSILRGEMMDNY